MTSSTVIGLCPPSLSRQVIPSRSATAAATTSASSRERDPFPVWGVGSQRIPAPDSTGSSPSTTRSAVFGCVVEQTTIEGRRDERVHGRVHPAGCLEEDATLGRHRLRVADEVFERRRGRATGVDALGHHRELVLVADEDDRSRARPDRHGVGERHLARLVHEEDVEGAVELGPSEEPARPGHDVDGPGRPSPSRPRHCCPLGSRPGSGRRRHPPSE